MPIASRKKKVQSRFRVRPAFGVIATGGCTMDRLEGAFGGNPTRVAPDGRVRLAGAGAASERRERSHAPGLCADVPPYPCLRRTGCQGYGRVVKRRSARVAGSARAQTGSPFDSFNSNVRLDAARVWLLADRAPRRLRHSSALLSAQLGETIVAAQGRDGTSSGFWRRGSHSPAGAILRFTK